MAPRVLCALPARHATEHQCQWRDLLQRAAPDRATYPQGRAHSAQNKAAAPPAPKQARAAERTTAHTPRLAVTFTTVQPHTLAQLHSACSQSAPAQAPDLACSWPEARAHKSKQAVSFDCARPGCTVRACSRLVHCGRPATASSALLRCGAAAAPAALPGALGGQRQLLVVLPCQDVVVEEVQVQRRLDQAAHPHCARSPLRAPAGPLLAAQRTAHHSSLLGHCASGPRCDLISLKALRSQQCTELLRGAYWRHLRVAQPFAATVQIPEKRVY